MKKICRKCNEKYETNNKHSTKCETCRLKKDKKTHLENKERKLFKIRKRI